MRTSDRAQLETQIDMLAESVAKGFIEMGAKFESVREDIFEIKSGIRELKGDVAGLKFDVKALKEDVVSVKSLISSNRIDRIEDNVRTVKNHLKIG